MAGRFVPSNSVPKPKRKSTYLADANKRRVMSGSRVGMKAYGRVDITPASRPKTQPGGNATAKRLTAAQRSGGVKKAWSR